MNMLTIVWDGIRRRKIRTVLSMLGIAIAAAALFSLLSLRQGYESGMQAELKNMGAQVVAVAKGCPYESLAVIMMGGMLPSTLPESITAEIASIPNVSAASPNAIGAFDFIGHSQPLVGITGEELDLKPWWQIEGDFPQNFGEIMLGSEEHAAFLAAGGEYSGPGDTIQTQVGGETVPLKVVGVLEATGSKDDYTSFTTLETAQRLFNLEERIVSVNIQVEDMNKLPDTVAYLEQLPDVQAVTIAQVMGTIRNLMQTGENVLLMILLLALVIGGLGTMNTMLMTIFERTREIGVMKAIGASDSQIFNLFISEGIAICLAGSVLGVSAGALISLTGNRFLGHLVPVIPSQPVGQLSLSAALIAIAVPVAIGALSTFYPALRAAGLNPIESLKNE